MIDERVTVATPVCSVCIANYNGAEVIEDCLNSVFSQDCDFSFEVIVHDDASTDGSEGIIRDRYPCVTLITSENNVGFCVSNNRMVLTSVGRYVLLLNNDAALLPDALRILYEEATRENSAILSLPQYDAQTGALIDIGSLSDPFLNPVPNLDAARRKVAMVSGACLWIPKAVWEELGGFPEWFHTVAEDMYLACMARLRGYSVEALSRSGFKHHIGKTLGGGGVKNERLSTTLRRRALSERNKSFVMVLCYPAPFFQLLLPFHIASLLVEGIVLSLVKRNALLLWNIYLACPRALWKNRANLILLRRQVQLARKVGSLEFFGPFRWVPQKLRLLVRYGIPKIR